MDDIRVTNKILERTGERFFDEGFSGFTMDDIARDTGVSKKTLYRLIPSRNDLILKVLGLQIDKVQKKQEAIIADTDLDYRQKLKAVVKLISGFLRRIRRKAMQDMARLHPDLWELIRKRRMDVLMTMAGLLEQGQAAGEVRRDIPVSFMTHYFQSVLDAIVTPAMSLEEDMSPTELLESALALFFDGAGTGNIHTEYRGKRK